MILLSSPIKNDSLETTLSLFFLEIEIFTTKIVNSKSLRKICRRLLSTMNVLIIILDGVSGLIPMTDIHSDLYRAKTALL